MNGNTITTVVVIGVCLVAVAIMILSGKRGDDD